MSRPSSMDDPVKPARPGRHLKATDLHGVAQLASAATHEVISMTEDLHGRILGTMGLQKGVPAGRTSGLTGLVYRAVRGASWAVGAGVERLLTQLRPWLESTEQAAPGTPEREAVLAALNGVMGDRLAAMNSPFATPMSLRLAEGLDFAETLPDAPSPHLLLVIHGLCMNDRNWQATVRGEALDTPVAGPLAAAIGAAPVYLRYNTGLHISQNGRLLAGLMAHWLERWPVPVEQISVLGHSMGGLLIRSAMQIATAQGLAWPDQVRSIVFLGTPHHGAPLERAGHWVDQLLGSLRFAAPFARLGQLRSAGITDLRHGHVQDIDWAGLDRFSRRAVVHHPLPLPEGVACYAVAATLAARRSPLADRLLGDGLVPLRSALGQADDAARQLGFAPASQWIAWRTGHVALLSDPAVLQQLLAWLAPRAAHGTALAVTTGAV